MVELSGNHYDIMLVVILLVDLLCLLWLHKGSRDSEDYSIPISAMLTIVLLFMIPYRISVVKLSDVNSTFVNKSDIRRVLWDTKEIVGINEFGCIHRFSYVDSYGTTKTISLTYDSKDNMINDNELLIKMNGHANEQTIKYQINDYEGNCFINDAEKSLNKAIGEIE